jgi:hypothetical protein
MCDALRCEAPKQELDERRGDAEGSAAYACSGLDRLSFGPIRLGPILGCVDHAQNDDLLFHDAIGQDVFGARDALSRKLGMRPGRPVSVLASARAARWIRSSSVSPMRGSLSAK